MGQPPHQRIIWYKMSIVDYTVTQGHRLQWKKIILHYMYMSVCVCVWYLHRLHSAYCILYVYNLSCLEVHVHTVSWQPARRQSYGTDSQPRARLTHPPEADLLERESQRLIYAQLFRKVKFQGSWGVPGVLDSVIMKRDINVCPHLLPA